MLSGSQISTYTTLSEDGEVYDEIKENYLYQAPTIEQPKSVEIPSIRFSKHEYKGKSCDDGGLSVKSERYSVFPSRVNEDDLGYLETSQSRASMQDPEPDYDSNDHLKPTHGEDYLYVIRTPDNVRRGSRVQQCN